MSPEWLARLTALCGLDSPTGDAAALAQTAALLAEWGRTDGLEVEVRETPTGPIVVLVTQGTGTARTLLIGHHDTVYPT
ncbi:MAG: M20 family peptidase, partial [Actinobacteria bacterium]|nr:M20 family peptidase [Actinomycetota bacterium]